MRWVILLLIPFAAALDDVVLSNEHYVAYLTNEGGALETSQTFVPAEPEAYEISSGDYDSDGYWDFAVNYHRLGKFSIFWGPEFIQQLYTIPICDEAANTCELHAIGSGDFNNDGKVDIALVDNGVFGRVFIYRNTDGRNFEEMVAVEVPGVNLRRIHVEDFNNDGNLDFIVPGFMTSSYYVGFGDGAGGFGVTTGSLAGGISSLFNIDALDFDNDGDKDIAVANNLYLTLLTNDGAGEFFLKEHLRAGISGQFMTVVAEDFDEDGDIDLVGVKNDRVVVFENKDGVFTLTGAGIRWSSPDTSDVETFDFDGDGILDIAGAVSLVDGGDTYAAVNVFTMQKTDVLSLKEALFFKAGENHGQIRIATIPQKPKEAFFRGDTNNDGIRNIADAVTILGYLFKQGDSKPKVTCLDTADANDDGIINIADAVKLLGHLFSNTGPLPEPFDAVGEDPTDDGIGCECYGVC